VVSSLQDGAALGMAVEGGKGGCGVPWQAKVNFAISYQKLEHSKANIERLL
jgi:hypothetical protein